MTPGWPEVTAAHRRHVDDVVLAEKFVDAEKTHLLEQRTGAVAVGNGTAALMLGLRQVGIRPSTRVAVPALSWSGTAWAVIHLGGTPMFVDTLRDQYVWDHDAIPDEAEVLLPVFLHGHSAVVPEGRPAVLDLCQAAGAFLRFDPEPGVCAATSLNETKTLWAGEGGLLATTDPEGARRMRHFGGTPTALSWGGNFRLSEMDAALALGSLEHLAAWEIRAERNAHTLLAALDGSEYILPPPSDGWHKFRLGHPRAQALLVELSKRNVPVCQWGGLPLPQQPAFAMFARGEYPEADRAVRESFFVGTQEQPLCAASADEVERWSEQLLEVLG